MAKLNFEKAMESLEKIVQELESGELALEEALKKFEEGIKLSRQCASKLEESEKKIALLMEKTDGTLEEKRFDSDDDFE
jgi:exodeoxyribonuclease VII small subunit